MALNVGITTHYHHGRKHANVQADMMLEKEPRALYLDPQATGEERDTGPDMSV